MGRAKYILQEYRQALIELDEAVNALAANTSALEKINSSVAGSMIMESANTDRMVEQLIEQGELFDVAFNAAVNACRDKFWAVYQLIQLLDRPKQRIVLVMRYLSAQNYIEIADRLEITYQAAQKTHDRALIDLDKLLARRN